MSGLQNLELTNIETSKTKTYRSIHNNDNTGERFYQDEGNIHQNEDTQVDTENLGEREITMIQDIWDLIKDNSEIELRGFNKVVCLPNGQRR